MEIKNFAIILQKLHLLHKLRNFVYVNIASSTTNELAIIHWDFISKIHNCTYWNHKQNHAKGFHFGRYCRTDSSQASHIQVSEVFSGPRFYTGLDLKLKTLFLHKWRLPFKIEYSRGSRESNFYNVKSIRSQNCYWNGGCYLSSAQQKSDN